MQEEKKSSAKRLGAYRRRLDKGMRQKLVKLTVLNERNTLHGLKRTVNARDDYGYDEEDKSESALGLLLSDIFSNNPVLFNALGISIIVGAADTLKKALLLTAATLVMMVLCEVISSLFFRDAEVKVRMTAFVLTAAAVMSCAGIYLTYNMPQETASLGIYLPLICITGLVTVRCENFAILNTPLRAATDAVGCSLGFGLIAVIVGTLREVTATGMLGTWGTPRSFPAANYSFFSFLLIGLLSAAGQHIRNTKRRKKAAAQSGGENA